MKLAVLFIILISLCSNTSFSAPSALVSADGLGYAQITKNNVYIYKTETLSDNPKDRWCLIEPSYFVKLLAKPTDAVYKAEYNGVVGYVKAADITVINETPQNPYPQDITFDITNYNCYFRLTPLVTTVTNNVLTVIPAATKNIQFIGKSMGEEAVDFRGTVWYLAKHNEQYGYIYSAYTTNITALRQNSETVSARSLDMFNKINPLTNPQALVIIGIILIPGFFIIYLLYHPKKAKVKNKIQTISYYEEDL